MLELRYYQNEIIEEARAALRTVKSIMIQLPTGAGKTVLCAAMLGVAASKKKTCWFIVHRRELVRQSSTTFDAVGIGHRIVAAGFQGNRKLRVQICSIQTVSRRLDRLPAPDLIVFDEAHHVAASSWVAICERFPNAVRIGLSATPERLDGRGLGKWFASLITGPSVSQLIEEGYLSEYRLFEPGSIDAGQVHTRMGDYIRSELEAVADKPKITGDAIDHYRKYANGKRAVVFCVSVAHSRHIVDAFNSAGITAEHVDGESDSHYRDAAIKRFTTGETLILSNVELFGEGFDLPAIECAILLRPTKSLTIYLQQVGRALRPSPGKKYAIILDHAGNSKMHGRPHDPRTWSLASKFDGKKKSIDVDKVDIKRCPMCFYVMAPHKTECKVCGHVFQRSGREVEIVEGELTEVNLKLEREIKLREQSQATSFEELVKLGRLRGYKKPEGWAKHMMNARQAKKLQQGRSA